MIYYWDKKLKKRLHVLKADIIIIKKNIDLMSLAQRMYFLLNTFRMTAIAVVSVINHYHINGLHLFWDTLYQSTSKSFDSLHYYYNSPSPSYSLLTFFHLLLLLWLLYSFLNTFLVTLSFFLLHFFFSFFFIHFLLIIIIIIIVIIAIV